MWLPKDTGAMSSFVANIKNHNLSWKTHNDHPPNVYLNLWKTWMPPDICCMPRPCLWPSNSYNVLPQEYALSCIITLSWLGIWRLVNPSSPVGPSEVDPDLHTDSTLAGCESIQATEKSISQLAVKMPVWEGHFHCKWFGETLRLSQIPFLPCKGRALICSHIEFYRICSWEQTSMPTPPPPLWKGLNHTVQCFFKIIKCVELTDFEHLYA